MFDFEWCVRYGFLMKPMKYFINYQHVPQGAERPVDCGDVFDENLMKASTLEVVPNVGDYVELHIQGGQTFSGKVRSRLFRYIGIQEEVNCIINIVVADTDDDWGLLVKE